MGAGEQQGVGPGSNVGVEMCFQFRQDVRRDSNHAATGLGLRRSEPDGPVSQLLRLLGDRQTTVEQIDVTPTVMRKSRSAK